MQPSTDHLAHDYPHDEILDRPLIGWHLLRVGAFVAMVVLLLVLVR